MRARGELDKLQEAIAKRLLSLGDFAVADIFCEGANLFDHGAGKACGVKITVKIPMPVSASKYAAGPVFSRVFAELLLERDDALARHSPSLASLAESASKALHFWTAPLECGYGKLTLGENSPWKIIPAKDGSISGICINFSAQSVIE